jgi:hypothetical protein
VLYKLAKIPAHRLQMMLDEGRVTAKTGHVDLPILESRASHEFAAEVYQRDPDEPRSTMRSQNWGDQLYALAMQLSYYSQNFLHWRRTMPWEKFAPPDDLLPIVEKTLRDWTRVVETMRSPNAEVAAEPGDFDGTEEYPAEAAHNAHLLEHRKEKRRTKRKSGSAASS